MSKGFYAKLNDLLNLLAPIIESIEPIEDQAMLWYQTIQHLRGVTSIQTTQTYESVWLTIKVMLDARLSSRAFGQLRHTNNTLAPSPANTMVPSYSNPIVPPHTIPMVQSYTNPMVPTHTSPMVPTLHDQIDIDRTYYINYVKAYICEKGYNIDVDDIIKKLDAQGWKDNKGRAISNLGKYIDKIVNNYNNGAKGYNDNRHIGASTTKDRLSELQELIAQDTN